MLEAESSNCSVITMFVSLIEDDAELFPQQMEYNGTTVGT
jgi:hypothetical protein